MDKKRSARAAASRYRGLVSASANIDRSIGSHSRAGHIEVNLPRYDPEKEADKALDMALKQKELGYFAMFRYATLKDFVLMGIGVVCAILWALILPTTICAIGKWVEVMLDNQYCRNEAMERNRSMIGFNSSSYNTAPHHVRTNLWLHALVLCVILFVTSAVTTGAFSLAAENQTIRIRLSYFESILRKDMAWLDNYIQREFGRHMTHDVTIIRNGLGGRVGYFVFAIVVVPCLLYTAFSINWLVTLVTFATLTPFMAGAGRLALHFEKQETKAEDQLSDTTESYAEQVLSNIKAVKLFSTEEYECGRYGLILREALILWKYACYSGICVFLLWSVYHYVACLSLYFGRRMISTDFLEQGCDRRGVVESITYPLLNIRGGGALFVIFLCVVLATIHITETFNIIAIIAETKKIAADVFFMIDWKPRIDNMSTHGEIPGAKAVGKIEFENVTFRYPRKMYVNALKNVSLTVQLGQLVTILGDSGCGKSTILRLMHRLYDPTDGSVYFDGRHIEALNVGWLRSQIGHVTQKPILFNKSVDENVRYANWEATQAEVEGACKMAGVHDEILLLPQGYKTVVGQHGKLLRLAQRRRIALARAFLQKPKVLLLDDPVSEADQDYEEFLLSVINQVRQNTTVVVTASDVNSIVRQSDRIYVMDRGQILQEGSHAFLMETDGLYSMMENGIDAGIPAERKLRLTSQLKSYNFAKTLRKWKLDKKNRDEKKYRDADAASDIDSDIDLTKSGKHEDSGLYDYQRKTRVTPYVLGGFNTFHYARRDTQAYNLRDGDKGVKKAKNIGGLAILQRRVTQLKRKQNSNKRKPDLPAIRDSDTLENAGEAYAPAIRDAAQHFRSRFFSRTSLQSEQSMDERDDDPDPDTLSIQSETDRYGAFWEEYETILESLDDDAPARSWKDIFVVGFHAWWIPVLAVIISGSLGFCSTFSYSVYGTFYEETTHSGILKTSQSPTPSIQNFIIAGTTAGILAVAQTALFTCGCYKLTAMLKVKLFRKMLAQDLEWFDLPENDISILCQRLSIDTVAIENTLMVSFGVLSQGLTQFLSSVIVVIYYAATDKNSHGLAVFASILIPLSFVYILVLYLDGRSQISWNTRLDTMLAQVADTGADAVLNIRTVITLGLEEHFLAQMTEQLKIAERKIFWENIYRNAIFGLSRVFPYVMYAAIAGRTLDNIKTGNVATNTWHLVLFTELLIRNQVLAGMGLSMFPNSSSARAAATKIRQILTIKEAPTRLSQLTKPTIADVPTIVVENLCYQCAENPISLNDINFEVKPKGFLGIVGVGPDSGSSMLINILARFYKPTSGSILFDKFDIFSMDLKTFRAETAFFEESPTIFDLSIKENIVYGLDADKITIEQIVKVAVDVKIHDIIIRLPQGYDTLASSLGYDDRMCGLLQRLIIARALIRNPKVIFIDGHTTSLNEEEDAMFQQAIAFCGHNRTKVVATERISLVKKADSIIVLQDGYIVETGTHHQLLESKRLYYQMHMNQKTLVGAMSEMNIRAIDWTASPVKRRSLYAYERYLQKRMFPQVPRGDSYALGGSLGRRSAMSGGRPR